VTIIGDADIDTIVGNDGQDTLIGDAHEIDEAFTYLRSALLQGF
jgi:hypothetical protein